MDKVSHFSAWLHENLRSIIASATEGKVEVDKSKNLVKGHSAGEDARSITNVTPDSSRLTGLLLGTPCST